MLSVDDVKKIKEKIEVLKTKKSKAEGVMESLKKRWREEFGLNSVEEVEAKVKSLSDEINEGERRVAVLLDRLEKSYDWSSV